MMYDTLMEAGRELDISPALMAEFGPQETLVAEPVVEEKPKKADRPKKKVNKDGD